MPPDNAPDSGPRAVLLDPRWRGLVLITAGFLTAFAGVVLLFSGELVLGRRVGLAGVGLGIVGMVVHLWLHMASVMRK